MLTGAFSLAVLLRVFLRILLGPWHPAELEGYLRFNPGVFYYFELYNLLFACTVVVCIWMLFQRWVHTALFVVFLFGSLGVANALKLEFAGVLS